MHLCAAVRLMRRGATRAETVRRIRLLLDGGLPPAIVAKIMPCFTEDGASLDACVADYLRDHLAAVKERMAELDHQRATIERLQQLVGA
jgi:hypothetical protein